MDVQRYARPLSEEIEELRAKITLLDGDRKAYFENCEWTKKQNWEEITKLRKENKELHQTLSDCLAADDHVINKAFEEKPVERAKLKNKTGSHAVTIMDYSVLDQEKRLNKLKHISIQKQKKLEELELLYGGQIKESEDAQQMDDGVSQAAETLRNLENQLDKSQLKVNEADHIRRTYEQIKDKLEEDSLNYPNVLDALEKQIIKCRTELRELKALNRDAEMCKESALNELKANEEAIYRERKDREMELQHTKREAEERKPLDRLERKLQRTGSFNEEATIAQLEPSGTLNDIEDDKITEYEERFNKIKEACGVSDTNEVLVRFESQDIRRERLEELKAQHERKIERLVEEKEALERKYEEMKYTGEEKLSSGQRVLEDFQVYLEASKHSRDESQAILEHSSNILVGVKSGVEHISSLLKPVKAVKAHVLQTNLSADSDEYCLDQLSQGEEKLLKVLEFIEDKGHDVEELIRNLKLEGHASTETTKLPPQNTRIKLIQSNKDAVYDDEDDSGDEGQGVGAGADIKNRAHLKKEAELMMENKNKRKVVKGKSKRK